MLTVLLNTVRESFHRRMGVALLVLAGLFCAWQLFGVRFETLPKGEVVAHVGPRTQFPAPVYAEDLARLLLGLTSGLWLFLGVFASAPLLTSFLEKGWAELLLSKGVSRLGLLLGRMAGAFCVFFATILLLAAVPMLNLWFRAGIQPGRFFAAVFVLVGSFAVLLSLMVLVAISSSNSTLAIIVAFLQMGVSAALSHREQAFYGFITARWARWLMDWAYRILPKNDELSTAAVRYYHTGKLDTWWPFWSSGVFAVAVLGLAYYLFHRKSF